MTYYQNKQKIINKISNDDQQSKNPTQIIKQLVTQLLANIHGFLIITNVSSKQKHNFYSLTIDEHTINLIEKNPDLVNTYCYEIDNNKLILNNEKKTPEFFILFCQKLTQIINDLKLNKAYAYEKKL